MDPRILRSSPFREAIEHLRDVRNSSNDNDITAELLHLIAIDSIPPIVFGQWLGVARSPQAVRAALAQNFSIEVRRLAIKKLGKLLSSPLWLDTWSVLGDVPGLLKLFGDFSVQELKQVCRVFVRSVKNSAIKADNQSKQAKITELVKALLPQVFSEEANDDVSKKDGVLKNDDRQLRAIYQQLLPKCTDDVAIQVVSEGPENFEKHKRSVLLTHSDVLQDLAVQYVFENNVAGKRWLEPLLSEYPPADTDVKGVSASMQFSLRMLQRLTQDDAKASLPVDFAITNLAESLLKRSLKKNLKSAFTQEVVDLTMAYLHKHPDAVSTLSLDLGKFIQLVGVCWSRQPELYTERFLKLLSLPFHKVGRVTFIQTMTSSALKNVAKSRRYSLMLFYYTGLYNADLSQEDPKSGDLYHLTHTLLEKTLPAEDALDLFTRMRLIKGDERIIGLSQFRRDDGTVDADMVHTMLLFRCGRCTEAEGIARKGLEACKKAAVSGAKPERRSVNARRAIGYATASGSLQLCLEAHEWARRFLRDPLTMRSVYQSNPNEAKILLSGVYGRLDENTSVSEIRNQVQHANKILLYMFETVFLAVREPSFDRDHFQGIFRLFRSVVSERIRQSKKLKKYTRISDDKMYQILWDGLSEMQVEIEKKALARGFEKLRLDTTYGILGNYPIQRLAGEEPSTYRFLDELAKARDALWKTYRRSVYPAVTILPDAFPRGLPVQDLLGPFRLDVHDLQKRVPYIAARVEAAVFPDPVAALSPVPEDWETRDAVGAFIDDYASALRMMVPDSLNVKERQNRVNRAWSYAIGNLGSDRFTHEETLRYWQRNAWPESAPWFWPGSEVNQRTPDWPVVPGAEHHGEVEEWNPVPSGLHDIPKIEPEQLTYVDMTKAAGGKFQFQKTVQDRSLFMPPVIPAIEEPKLFSSVREAQAKATPAIREGQILASLLFIDNTLLKPQLLRSAFPPVEQQAFVRYPKVYLDGECLSNNAHHGGDAFDCLQVHLSSVPPSLLHQLAANAFSALQTCPETDEKYRNLENNTLRLAKMLTQCDRPALASELVVRMVLERPDNSAWHRQLLSRSFFRRLPASVAQDCMNTFAGAIIAEVDRQNATKIARSSGPLAAGEEKQSQQPYIKVTTIKLLAQLLGDTQFISETFALSVLSRLIEKASHVDARRAVVDNLLTMFEDAPSSKVDTILTALETIIPLAGNLRERQPITASEWASASSTLQPPSLDGATPSSETTAPLLWSLLSTIRPFTPGSPLHARHSALVTRILLPITTSLTSQLSQWTSLFLLSHGISPAVQETIALPPLPRDYALLHELLRRATPYLPATFLSDLLRHRTFNITPPPEILPLLTTLNATAAHSHEANIKFFRANYALSLRASTLPFNPIHLLRPLLYPSPTSPPQDPLLPSPISPTLIQQIFLSLYTTTLLHDAPPLKHVLAQHRALWPYSPGEHVPAQWGTYIQPIVSAVIAYVEGLRTRAWERDPARHPAFLPDVFPLRMLLLRFAARHSEHAPGTEDHARSFAARVEKVIDGMAGGVYHDKLRQVKECTEYLGEEDRLWTAVYLGDVSRTRLSWLTVEDCLRVEVAAGLVGREVKGEGEVKERVRGVVGGWRGCENEGVRRVGWGVEI